MAVSSLTQSYLAVQYKNALRAYNSQIDITSVGTYWDVTAASNASIAKEVADWMQQVHDGNAPQNANPLMLEYWTSALGIAPRKTGAFASGLVKCQLPSYPTTIPTGTQFIIVSLKYVTTSDQTLTKDGNIKVVAEKVGTEYNIFQDTSMTSTIAGTFTSQGFYGGTSDESDPNLLARILLNLSRRKTDGMLTDYIQRALELYGYVEAKTLFLQDVIPYGVETKLAHTIQDYDTAAASPIINEIALSAAELNLAESTLVNYSTVTAVNTFATYSTQNITNLVIYILPSSGTQLTSTEVLQISKATRKALLLNGDDVLTRFTLRPDFSGIIGADGKSRVEDYFFNSFAPITRVSPLMDSVNIGVISVTET